MNIDYEVVIGKRIFTYKKDGVEKTSCILTLAKKNEDSERVSGSFGVSAREVWISSKSSCYSEAIAFKDKDQVYPIMENNFVKGFLIKEK